MSKASLSVSAIVAIAVLAACQRGEQPAPKVDATEAVATASIDMVKIRAQLDAILKAHRQLVVLFTNESLNSPASAAAANRVGQLVFHENLDRIANLDAVITASLETNPANALMALEELLSYVESGNMFDADRLAFKETLHRLQKSIASVGTLPAIKLHKRIGDDLSALDEIERQYERELKPIFARFGTRSIELKRERWEDYLAYLHKIMTREEILKELGAVVPIEAPGTKLPVEKQIFGYQLPPKTVVLTFDDGPHGEYTSEIAAILKKYSAPAVFFQVGKNIGTVGANGDVKLMPRGAKVSKALGEQGFVIANHSYSHAQLSKVENDVLKAEIGDTDTLLKAIDPNRSVLFRFPYGDNNDLGLELIAERQLQSVMWNVDSLDWADPVPDSIVERVLRILDEEKRGIILFHDIHERTVKALPKILDRLVSDGYRFAAWNGTEFVAPPQTLEEEVSFSISSEYGDSWAIVIGIDDYLNWPKLQYATRDAEAVRDTLVNHFGFQSDHVFLLKNEQASRSAIMSLFHDRFAHGEIKKNDRLLVFFAGHGATRKLSSGRDLGYIIPVDSSLEDFAADAIPMTDIQNIAESVVAKHVLFVMDACYSGLGLTRGGAMSFLKDNARRVGRQMITAGGADQLVADGGPNGHSVFTWTFLQALSGKGDLNGDGLMTATELAAYLGPAVAAISPQTPAFGSLPGSEGGEFVFERRAEAEFLHAGTTQLVGEAIAMNQKLAEAQPTTTNVPIKMKDLQGKERTLKLPRAVSSTARQLAQRANDKGLQLYREQQYDEAEAQFTEALRLRPDFALAANNLGFIYYKRGKYDAAIRWYENTVKLDPSRAIAYLNLGDAAMKINDSDRARQAYETYLALVPNATDAAQVREALNSLR